MYWRRISNCDDIIILKIEFIYTNRYSPFELFFDLSQAYGRYNKDRSKGFFIDDFSYKFYKNKKINDGNV